MQAKLKCIVSKVEKKSKYTKDYKSYQIDQSTLTILENTSEIDGCVTVQGALPYGEIFEIVVNTDNPIKVVEEVPVERPTTEISA